MGKPSDANPSAGPPNLQVRQKNTAAVLTGCVEAAELEDGARAGSAAAAFAAAGAIEEGPARANAAPPSTK